MSNTVRIIERYSRLLVSQATPFAAKGVTCKTIRLPVEFTFNSMNIEDDRHVCKGKDAFSWLPTSFGTSVHYEVLSFVCLTVNKASWVQAGVATPLSC